MELDSLERFVGKYALGYEKGEGSNHFLRIKVVGGELTTTQAKAIAELSETYGKGYLEITTRHDIQLHWIKDEDAPEIFAKLEKLDLTTDMCGQAYPEARYGDVRNIVTCPVSGVQKGELIDTLPIVKETVKFFTGRKEYLDLPRKFKIAISGCPLNCIKPEINDLALIAVKIDDSIGFTVLIGGGIGPPPILAKPMNIYIAPEEALSFIKAIVEVYRDYGSRESKAKARFKWMVEVLGVEKIKTLIEEKLGKKLKSFDAKSLNLNWEEHIGCQPQKQDGLFFLVVPIPMGMLTSDKFLRIAQIADDYCGGKFRLSPLQKIVLVNIPEERLHEVEERLKQIGFFMNKPSLRWTAIACPGHFCGKALENPKIRALEAIEHLERVFNGKLKNDYVRICFSGCPNSCGHHAIADIGLQAVKLENGDPIPAYNIYLGGKAKVSKLFLKAVPADEVKLKLEDIIKAYLNSQDEFKSFRDFAESLLVRGKLE
ncbi:MAG: nitrite/sulfite reductase [Candidatus Bathyarchaeia archaeon]